MIPIRRFRHERNTRRNLDLVKSATLESNINLPKDNWRKTMTDKTVPNELIAIEELEAKTAPSIQWDPVK